MRLNRGLPHAIEAAAAAVALVLASPVLVAAALAVRLSSPGSILFRQTRVGRDGRSFTLLKFRTMREGAGGPQVTARGDSRITTVGRWLRASKVDELPQLLNVLRGDMSLVGPRPEVPRYVDLTDPRWAEVLSARPGLTDPVTLRLRNEETLMAEHGADADDFYRTVLQPYKLTGYAEYLRSRSAWSDLRVLAQTVNAVIRPNSVPAVRPEEFQR